MSDVAEANASPMTEARARAILRPISAWLADHLGHRCRCNACYVCAATFLVKMQDRLTGPTFFVTGWRLGMNKIGVGKALHEAGLSIVDAHRTTNQILESFRRDDESRDVFDKGNPIRIQIAEGIDRDELVSQLQNFGLLIE